MAEPMTALQQPTSQPPAPMTGPAMQQASVDASQQMNPEEQGQAQQLDPKLQQKAENYISVLMNELHSPDTRDDVLEILKSAQDPFITVPQAAMAVNDAAAKKIERSGGKIDIQTMFLGSQYLVGDLMEIGNSFGVFQVTKDDFKDLYQDSLQLFIQRGLKDGSIDPIELQLTGEAMMTENQKIGGHYLAQQTGIPHAPQQTQVLQQFENRTKQKVLAEEADKRSKEAKMQNDIQVRQALMAQAQGGQ